MNSKTKQKLKSKSSRPRLQSRLENTTIEQHATTPRSVNINTSYKLKIISKKLASGKCQVKFFATQSGEKSLYGYTLVEAQTTLKDVVQSITYKLDQRQNADDYNMRHLYAMAAPEEDESNFMIFEG